MFGNLVCLTRASVFYFSLQVYTWIYHYISAYNTSSLLFSLYIPNGYSRAAGGHFEVSRECILPVTYFWAHASGTVVSVGLPVPDLSEFKLTITPEAMTALMDFHSGWQEVGDPEIPPTYIVFC